ncbi:hypothetical protein ACTGJ9_035925 [Bradyrhizobium sp. RDM12]
MRYVLELDCDRRNAGWGQHFWIIDGVTGERLHLCPSDVAFHYELQQRELLRVGATLNLRRMQSVEVREDAVA